MTADLRAAILSALEAHRRDRDQHDVWVPMIRCTCGAVMPSNRFRAHIADEVTTAVGAVMA